VNETLKHELKRKAFHALSAGYALVYTLAGRGPTLWTLGVLLAVVAAVEAVRLRSPGVNAALVRLFGGIHREHELHRPSGILWTLTGSFLTVLLIPSPDIALAALWYLAAGDAAAGVVGRNWGRVRIGDKSLEGSLACFLSCWFVGAACLAQPFGSVEVLLGALTATVAEAAPLPLNDNLWLPLLSGLALTALRSL
jgi:diacylglycerol kinase (CTP)